LEEKYQNEIAELKVFGWDLGEESIKIIWPILGEVDSTKWSFWGEAEKGQEYKQIARILI
jgi:hypothetical protein